MSTKRIPTVRLKGAALDWAVAQARGEPYRYVASFGGDYNGTWWHEVRNYSTNPNQGLPIVQSAIDCIRKRSAAEEAELAHPNPEFRFKAEIIHEPGYWCAHGQTMLVAGLRCYVLRHLGEVVEVPLEIL